MYTIHNKLIILNEILSVISTFSRNHTIMPLTFNLHSGLLTYLSSQYVSKVWGQGELILYYALYIGESIAHDHKFNFCLDL